MDNSSFSDQERMEDLLSQEKYLMDAYSTFLPETAEKPLRQILTTNFDECAGDQFTIFEKMSALGWYPVKEAKPQDLTQARDKLQGLYMQIN